MHDIQFSETFKNHIWNKCINFRSASTQGQKKEEGNPGQETQEKKKEKNDNENGNQEIGKAVEPESAIEDNKRKTNVKLDFERVKIKILNNEKC